MLVSRPSEGRAPAHAALRQAALVRHPGLARVVEAGYDDAGARVVEEVGEARPLADERCRLPRGDALAEGLLGVLRGLAHLHRQAMVHGAVSRQTVFSDGRDLLLTGVALSADDEGAASADVRAWGEMSAELLESSRGGELTEIVHEAAQQVLAAGPVGHSLNAPRVVRAINRALLSDDEMASQPVHDQEGVEDEIEKSGVMRALLAIVHLTGNTIVGLFTTVLTLALIGAVVAGGVLWFLDQLPAEVPVPNVVGMEREEARARLEADGLGIGRVRSVYREEVEPNHVAETAPPPGMMVREGREVTLVVSMGAARVDVPRLTGLKPAEAEELLDEKGLRLVEGGEMRSNMPEGEIVAQDPPPTRKIAQGERVVVQTSGGPSFGVIELPAEDEDGESRRMVFRQIEIIVPRGDALQRVRVREGYGDDLETTYDRLHRPGDRIKLDTYGRPGKHIHVSIEGEQVFKTQL
ncbi:MAG: PASTA domain-containing protein [Armatimonadota bacterium]